MGRTRSDQPPAASLRGGCSMPLRKARRGGGWPGPAALRRGRLGFAPEVMLRDPLQATRPPRRRTMVDPACLAMAMKMQLSLTSQTMDAVLLPGPVRCAGR